MTSFNPTLAVINGIPRASSLDIAEHFGKRHVDVMRAINKSIMQVPEDFAQRNFAFSEYRDCTGRTLPKCDLTHDGFSFVVMGFTGKEAAKWKVVCITAFRAMADELAAQREAALPQVPHTQITLSTPASRKPLEKLVKVWAAQGGLIHAQCWTMLDSHFGLVNIKDLPQCKVQEAINWVQAKIDALSVSQCRQLPRPVQKALPAPEADYRERCAAITAQMLKLRGSLFHVSNEMKNIFRLPFWGTRESMLKDRQEFASNMNHAIQAFFMAVNKDIEAAELLFDAYVEAEKIMQS